MDKQNNEHNKANGKHEHPLPQEIKSDDRKQAVSAHDEAEKDMEQDADFTSQSPNDDLDEGETARLGEDNTDLI